MITNVLNYKHCEKVLNRLKELKFWEDYIKKISTVELLRKEKTFNMQKKSRKQTSLQKLFIRGYLAC